MMHEEAAVYPCGHVHTYANAQSRASSVAGSYNTLNESSLIEAQHCGLRLKRHDIQSKGVLIMLMQIKTA